MSDSEIKVKVSPLLLQVFKESRESTLGAPANVKRVVADGKGVVKVADIEWLQSHMQGVEPREERVQLHSLLEGCEVLLPGLPVVPRNAELEARVCRLKDQQQERLYRAMTKNVDSVRVKQPEDTIAYQVKQINRQLIAVLQFVFSVGAGFVFGFLGIELIVGNLDFGFRLLLGVICALVIALAEIYFLAKKLAEDFEAPVRPPVSLQPAMATKPHSD